jgi:hypothetical protein
MPEGCASPQLTKVMTRVATIRSNYESDPPIYERRHHPPTVIAITLSVDLLVVIPRDSPA